MGRRRIPSPLQKAGAWRLQLAPYQRRGTGDHAGTIPCTDAGAGDRIQTSDPGSTAQRSPLICDTLCKMEKFKNLFWFPLADTVEVIHIRVSYDSFNSEYFTAIGCCVDKYSEKLKKLFVFSAFQSVYPLVRMTNSFFVRFAFSFGLRYNNSSSTKER